MGKIALNTRIFKFPVDFSMRDLSSNLTVVNCGRVVNIACKAEQNREGKKSMGYNKLLFYTRRCVCFQLMMVNGLSVGLSFSFVSMLLAIGLFT